MPRTSVALELTSRPAPDFGPINQLSPRARGPSPAESDCTFHGPHRMATLPPLKRGTIVSTRSRNPPGTVRARDILNQSARACIREVSRLWRALVSFPSGLPCNGPGQIDGSVEPRRSAVLQFDAAWGRCTCSTATRGASSEAGERRTSRAAANARSGNRLYPDMQSAHARVTGDRFSRRPDSTRVAATPCRRASTSSLNHLKFSDNLNDTQPTEIT